MKKRTRLTVTYLIILFLSIVIFFAMYKGMENLAITCVTAIIGSGLGYIWGESKRPSQG